MKYAHVACRQLHAFMRIATRMLGRLALA